MSFYVKLLSKVFKNPKSFDFSSEAPLIRNPERNPFFQSFQKSNFSLPRKISKKSKNRPIKSFLQNIPGFSKTNDLVSYEYHDDLVSRYITAGIH